ncbi:MAG: hypothetical protein ACRENY_00420 [Candidatus Dormibacteria bacterium]
MGSAPAAVEPSAQPDGFRLLWFGLGFFWLLDAALQLQPAMFTSAFSQGVLWNSAYMYQPPGLRGFLATAAGIESAHLVALNALIVAVQVLTGALLFSRRTRTAGLLLGLGWGLAVWVFGEGLGFMATGTALSEGGAPGSSLMYAVLSLIGLVALRRGARAGLTAARLTWSGYWLLGAALHIPIRYGVGAVLAYNLQTAAQDLPGPLSKLDYAAAHQAYVHSLASLLLVVVVEVAVGLGIWWRPLRRPALLAGVLVSVPFWVLGQAMGSITTGIATDPDTAPLVALLGILLWRLRDGGGALAPREADPYVGHEAPRAGARGLLPPGLDARPAEAHNAGPMAAVTVAASWRNWPTGGEVSARA